MPLDRLLVDLHDFELKVDVPAVPMKVCLPQPVASSRPHSTKGRSIKAVDAEMPPRRQLTVAEKLEFFKRMTTKSHLS